MKTLFAPTERGRKVRIMDEYIKRSDIAEKSTYLFDTALGYTECVTMEDIEDIPSADVSPVRHGRWILIETDEEQLFFCSECKDKEYWESDFCPACGAKMDGGNRNE